MIATSINQSKRLVEAGMSPKSADMCYQSYAWESDENGDPKNIHPIGGLTLGNQYMDYPAWSLSALWKEVSSVGKFAFDEEDTPEDMIESLVTLYEEYSNR